MVETEDDAITVASSLRSGNVTPIFTISCVAGHGLDLIYKFLYVLPPFISNRERERLLQLECEFQVCPSTINYSCHMNIYSYF